MAKKPSEKEQRELQKALDQLTPEQAEMFVQALELTMKKRRIMLLGYLLAVLAIVIGFGWALYMYGTHEYGTFFGWVFLIPFAIAGATFILFGKIARRMKK